MSRIQKFLVVALVLVPVLAQLACSDDKGDGSGPSMRAVTSVEHFNTILEDAGGRLLAFDLYAEWCMPCHVLNPTLAEIAQEEGERVSIYQIDTDLFPQITEAFGATGIPFVVFVKNQRAVYALLGVQPKDTYLQVIETYSDSGKEDFDVVPNGQSVEGLRVMQTAPKERSPGQQPATEAFYLGTVVPTGTNLRMQTGGRPCLYAAGLRFHGYTDLDSPVILPCSADHLNALHLAYRRVLTRTGGAVTAANERPLGVGVIAALGYGGPSQIGF